MLEYKEGVISIGDCAFQDNDLISVIVSSSVEKIGYNAFSGNSLSNITINGISNRFDGLWRFIGFPYK